MFESLPTEDLINIFEETVSSEILKTRILELQKEFDPDSVKSYAFAEFWERKIKESSQLSIADVQQLLQHLHLFSTRNIIGTLAEKKQISDQQCKALQSHLQPDEWSYRQLTARLKLNQLRRNINEGKYEWASAEALDQLKTFATINIWWPIDMLILELPTDVLLKFQEAMNTEKIFYRSTRHELNEKIKRRLKISHR